MFDKIKMEILSVYYENVLSKQDWYINENKTQTSKSSYGK